ncbi:glutamyl aminopeptidase [Narcine bancroftii]|uniref:glutamyl aminopeptidase n=1 Tax=Narcine bancroftii TaxID=1343680 RepID=UPI0038314D78
MQPLNCEVGERMDKEGCIRWKYVAIVLCGLLVAVGLAVGLGVGLSRRNEVCEEWVKSTPASTTSSVTASQPPTQGYCLSNEDSNGPWSNFRLPDYINPDHYDLELTPDMEGGDYTGKVVVHIHTRQATKYIWLHTKDGNLTAQPLLRHSNGSASSTELALRRCFEYKAHQYLVLEAEQELLATPPGHEYLLILHFQSSLLASLVGFYKTTYQENGVVKSIAATDHEPTDARKTFPCFDEPNKKATYTISLIYSEPYQVLSNMPVENEENLSNGLKKATFKKSVRMSTYLVCFAVHQFDYVEKISKANNIPLRIYVQPQQRHTAMFAADVMKTVFDYFEEYFNISYALPKLDMIAIPDFGTGAMENWGLITYRETNLLFDVNESSSYNRQRVATVVAHELVHQWFGNLVTMDWWDDLWLNEGFASFFEYIGVHASQPSWLMIDQILTDEVLPVMADDALLSSHPIIVNVSTPAEITSVFDGISYSKGASILRMLRNWITPDTFQKGCQKYLRDHQFQNAKTDDFWKALAQASGLPVKEVMDTWTQQMGFPVLNVDSNGILTQKRFLLDPNANATQPPSPLKYQWNIPIQWHILGGTPQNLFFNLSNPTEKLPNQPPSGIQKLNMDHIGFYRVQYEESAWDNITQQLRNNHTWFSDTDRTGLIDDAFSLARATLLNYSVALNMTEYLYKEEDYLPWSKAISSIAYIQDMLQDNYTLYPKFQAYWRKQVKPITNQLGWNDSDIHLKRLLREDVLGLACRMGDAEALSNATSLFEEWLTGKSIPANLRLIVYRYGMQEAGSESSWEFMFKKYQETPLAQEKDKLLYGLASVENVQLLDRYLKYIKNESLIKTQDVFTVLQYISYNKYGKTMAWDWTRLNWEYLVDRYTINDRNLGRLVLRITTSFNTELSLWQMEDFFAKYPEAGAGELPRKQALESVQTNINWLKNNLNEIEQWLQGH